jgi:hypothetical protein
MAALEGFSYDPPYRRYAGKWCARLKKHGEEVIVAWGDNRQQAAEDFEQKLRDSEYEVDLEALGFVDTTT